MQTLVNFRNDQGLTKQAMADKLGFSLSFYEKIEQGIRNPSYNFLKRLKNTFPCVDMNIFFEV